MVKTMPWLKFSQPKEEKYFELTVDRSLITSAFKGTYNIKILVYDDKSTFKDANIYETDLTLEYFEIKKEASNTTASLDSDLSGIKVGDNNVTNTTDAGNNTLDDLNIT